MEWYDSGTSWCLRDFFVPTQKDYLENMPKSNISATPAYIHIFHSTTQMRQRIGEAAGEHSHSNGGQLETPVPDFGHMDSNKKNSMD